MPTARRAGDRFARPTLNPVEEGGGAQVPRELRASDDERQAVVRRLERAFRDGRLTVVEFDERMHAAYAARTRGELDDLTEDLPPDLW
jgi:hypothetical protein